MPRPIDPVERAHLRDRQGFAPPIRRYAPSPDLADLVRRYWIPVWSLPEGVRTEQRVLQYPVCLIVVEADSALLYGPTSGLSVTPLTGSGWAFGTMLQPAAGAVLSGRSVAELTDATLPLAEVPALAGLGEAVRTQIGDRPGDADRLEAALADLEHRLRTLLPVDEEGLLVNQIVEYVEGEREVRRVAQVCAKFAIGERTLQRLTARRIGLSPKWLIQRRRLHEAAEALAAVEPPDLARVAADLGYADQAHFTRDFRTVTGVTPGEFAQQPKP